MNRFFRQALIYLMSALIVSLSFAIIIFAYDVKDDFAENGFKASECGAVVTLGQAYEDW